MEDWLCSKAYEAEHERRNEEIRSRYPDLVQGHLFSCHVGWFDLLERLFGEIADILKDGDVTKFELRQVKQKFGSLRFYWRYRGEAEVRDRINLAVFAAECRSEMTCEICGKPGLQRVGGGWLSTRCDDHGTERGKPMVVTPPAEEQAAWVPEMERIYADGRYARYAYDREADRVVLVEEGVTDDDD